jgi:mannosylglycerate hydrolase
MKLNKVSFNTPTNFSLFEKEKNSIVLSTVKKAEHENKLLVRLFNSSNETSFNDNIKFNNKKVIRMASVKLSENEIEELDYNTENNLGEFTPCKVKTFSFNIK